MTDAGGAAHRSITDAVAGLTIRWLPPGSTVSVPASTLRSRISASGLRVVESDRGGGAAPAPVDAVLLLDGELSGAGEHAETLISETVERIRPGGRLAATVDNALWSTGDGDRRAWRPTDLGRLFGGRGVAVEALWAPGAAARIAGVPFRFDEEADREESVLGAGTVLLALTRTPTTPAERSRVFFATLPRKAVASAALVLHPHDDRLLCVHDTFKGRWTIPGGVVDADEDPASAAVRETREEAGIDVRLTGLAGVFHGIRPDRVVFVFSAEPIGGLDPAPVHTHEIDGAAWMPVGEAVARVGAHTAEQITRGLGTPGQVWRQ